MTYIKYSIKCPNSQTRIQANFEREEASKPVAGTNRKSSLYQSQAVGGEKVTFISVISSSTSHREKMRFFVIFNFKIYCLARKIGKRQTI